MTGDRSVRLIQEPMTMDKFLEDMGAGEQGQAEEMEEKKVSGM